MNFKPTEIMVQTRNLVTGYKQGKSDSLSLHENLNLTVNTGTLVALLGKNGVGKSTLLRTLCGLLHPLRGEVYFKDQSLNSLSVQQRANTVAFVSSEIIHISHLTIYNMVALGRFPYTNWIGKLTSRDHEIVEKSIELTFLSEIKNKKINELSDGQRQRAMIARALAQDTPLIMLDEPTSFLDLQNRYEILYLLKKMAHYQQKAIVFTTHDLPMAMQYADEIWLMNTKEVETGCPEDLLWMGRISATFDNLRFNVEPLSGEVKVHKSFKGKVKLSGSGKFIDLTRKMLERIEIEVVEESDYIIDVQAQFDLPELTFKYFDKIFQTCSFSEFSGFLLNLFKP